ncbi:SDR family NAD(P)-dependent oxidoreductase [Novosphingobium kaempferiae]|uniref:SDR family NAD(P)-dependent oxidoreductase n=1 Tax=Novosphingobium kaempferiae TaxID=2896849 RepID=UPI001E5F4719|nr:glucose 1-dehydrogenase [Novosphingobium kaempferiae]
MKVQDVSRHSISELISLSGRGAVVTGAAWGLGKATARRLAEAGASVLIADIDEEGGAATAREIAAAYGANVISARMDASDVESIAAVAQLARSAFGKLDIWVNNAGVPSFTPLLELEPEEFDKVTGINLRGTFVGAREAARHMIADGNGGVIVNVASLAGVMGISENQAAYCASKHGVVGLTRQMAIELGPKAIRVLGVAPGFSLTEKTMFIAHWDEETVKNSPIPGIGASRLGRVGVADDIARAILFCVSDLSMFMTGSTLLLDGGIAA